MHKTEVSTQSIVHQLSIQKSYICFVCFDGSNDVIIDIEGLIEGSIIGLDIENVGTEITYPNIIEMKVDIKEGVFKEYRAVPGTGSLFCLSGLFQEDKISVIKDESLYSKRVIRIAYDVFKGKAKVTIRSII